MLAEDQATDDCSHHGKGKETQEKSYDSIYRAIGRLAGLLHDNTPTCGRDYSTGANNMLIMEATVFPYPRIASSQKLAQ